MATSMQGVMQGLPAAVESVTKRFAGYVVDSQWRKTLLAKKTWAVDHETLRWLVHETICWLRFCKQSGTKRFAGYAGVDLLKEISCTQNAVTR